MSQNGYSKIILDRAIQIIKKTTAAETQAPGWKFSPVAVIIIEILQRMTLQAPETDIA